MEYNFREIEQRWQQLWKQNAVYKVSNETAKPKCYVLDMFPYPSGAGLHVGHPLGYIASDIYSRYKRLKGFNVLHPMGFDSFGLPAEQYALETGQHPAVTTEKNIATFKSQLDKIGFCYDWSREVRTSDPAYYRWTQWIFLQLFESYFCNTQKKARPIADLVKKYETHGNKNFTAEEWKSYSEKQQQDILMQRRLAFSAYGEVNWCEALGTVLANDEVVNGKSERGGHPVIKKKMRQWYLRITAYADRLLEGLETVNFSDAMKEMQRNWIGKSSGAEMAFGISNSESVVKVYTTRPDTIFGVDFLVLAPEHELVQTITTTEQREEINNYLVYVKSRSDRERQSEVKQITGCFTGACALNPFNGNKIPIWIAEYVLAGYGTGAIMAVPCGDQRDFLFAKHFNIPITNIIGEHYTGQEANPTKEAILENSGFMNGLLMKDAIDVAMNAIEGGHLPDGRQVGKRKVNYKMRDAGFSRQRYWGEPFPIVWKDGVAFPLDANELPLELPHVETYGPGPEGEGPLANIKEWVLNPNLSPQVEKGDIFDLTPNPSPMERGTEAPTTFGYVQSTADEWRNTLQFAKQNRHEPTETEAIMWQALRNRHVAGCKFRRQHPIAGYIPDFVCLEKKLIVEIDGGYHNEQDQKQFDEARENWLKENGFGMMRFKNEEVNTSLKTVLDKIEVKLSSIKMLVEEVESGSPLLGRGVGGEVKRETSTMPGYAGSSWYFLRYMDPDNENDFCDRKASDYWQQVDVYVGGTEHAVGHLLYSRMWTKFLYDRGWISFDEPFKKLVNQGMITGVSEFLMRPAMEDEAQENNVTDEEIIFRSNFIEYILDQQIKRISISDIIDTKEVFYSIDLAEEINEIKKKKLNKIDFKAFTEIRFPITCVDNHKLDYFKLIENAPHHFSSVFVTKRGYFTKGRFVEFNDVTDPNTKDIFTKSVGEKMSKSKLNTENPDDLVIKYGADTFRMYEMFLGPVEQSKPWDTKGIEGVHRFLKKLWRLFFDEQKGRVWTTNMNDMINSKSSESDSPLPGRGVRGEVSNAEWKVLHKTIKKIEQDTENFSFNTAVSAFMVCVNELTDLKCHKKEVLEKLLVLLVPYAPHITEELWNAMGNKGSILDASYPVLEEKYLVESSKEYPISINGKLRTTINISLDADQKQVEAFVLENDIVQKWLKGKAPKKIIFVKNKMVNVVI